ncbi:cyclic nucleotide-binding domain-containing protein [Roseofilum sp. BLCC_M154]|uniref:Cyclic nucleotide-binding domain-containing protein n=1 Tax=Roseofilum acuticapitatum BLCC-M154 TaxID=3022444 RepID=A0ABT7AWK9_9CYAN|nr:cyclic nucleotide-binding domain-containing protein [Roseofilum acuticapitatum]MDJ1170962.1 cyclic nucleotide-binding domain-containing protein [Roseofilum acuticapitatum BLCC-M154]
MLEKFTLLSELTESQRQQVEKACDRRFYAKGDILFQENDTTDEIYFLLSGKVELCKIELGTQNNLKFKEMFPGESFGEMSFIDGSPRSCSIIAAEDSEVYILDRHKLIDTASEVSEIISTFGLTITRQVNSYLRYLSDRHVSTLQEQINELQERTNFANFLVFLLIVLFITAIVNSAIHQFFSESVLKTKLFSWSFLIIGFGIPLVLASWKTKLSPQEIGFTTKNLKRSTMDGILLTSIGIFLVLLICVVVDAIIPGSHLVQNFRNMTLPLSSLTYFVHSYIQEALRAIIQISLQKFLVYRKEISAICITALTFSMCHMHFGIVAIAVTLFSSILFGFIYIRTYNLLGVSIFHFIMGFVVFKTLLGF